MPRMVCPNRFLRGVRSKAFSVSVSAQRHLLTQLSKANLAEAHRPKFIRRSRLRPVEDMRMKRGPNEKECRAVALSSRRRRISNNSSNEAQRLPQPITARDTRSRKVGSEDNQDKRHRQASNNFGALTPAALE